MAFRGTFRHLSLITGVTKPVVATLTLRGRWPRPRRGPSWALYGKTCRTGNICSDQVSNRPRWGLAEYARSHPGLPLVGSDRGREAKTGEFPPDNCRHG